MIQDQTVVVTIDISDLQADLPLFGACTSGRPEDENLITLVDPNTLSPLVAEKQIVSEPPAQQEEVISVQEVPQSEIIVETVEDSLHCSIDEEASLEVPLDESETCSQTDDVSDVNLMSDDLASLLSEDLDDDLEKAAKDALSQQSLRPILKEELKTIIQHRRVRVGKGELKLDESRKRPAPDSEEEKEVTEEVILRKQRRRERNKIAAQKCRNKKKERTDELQQETSELLLRQKQMKEEVKKLEQEKEMLLTMLRFHDASPAARCGRKLSQKNDP